MMLDDLNPTVLAGLPASMRPAILAVAGLDGEADFAHMIAGWCFSSGVTVRASATASKFRGPDDRAPVLRPRGLAALCGLASNPNAGLP